MRLTFEGFELVREVSSSSAQLLTFGLEIRQLRGNENTADVPCEVQGVPVSGAHETCCQPAAPTSGSRKG